MIRKTSYISNILKRCLSSSSQSKPRQLPAVGVVSGVPPEIYDRKVAL